MELEERIQRIQKLVDGYYGATPEAAATATLVVRCIDHDTAPRYGVFPAGEEDRDGCWTPFGGINLESFSGTGGATVEIEADGTFGDAFWMEGSAYNEVQVATSEDAAALLMKHGED